MATSMASPLTRPPVTGRASFSALQPDSSSNNNGTRPHPGRRPRGLSVQHQRKPSLNNLNTSSSSSAEASNAASSQLHPPGIVTDPGTPIGESSSSSALPHHSAGSLTVNPDDYRSRDPSGSSVGQSSKDRASSTAGGGSGGGGSSSSAGGRKRSSSIVSVQEIQETYDEQLDQEALVNLNTDWVNFRGAWVVHLLLIVMGKVSVDMMPVERTVSWTIALQLYLGITFLMFHWVTGTPFSANGGAFDRLTFWEQIDHGAQYTPARKFLTSVPIAFFLLTTHYARYDLHPTLFTLNFISLLVLAVWPKLPAVHRLRFKFFSDEATSTSATGTPINGPSRAPSPSASQLTQSSLKNLNIARPTPYSMQVHTQHQPPIQEVSEPASPVVGSSTPPSTSTSHNWVPTKLKSRFLNRKSS